MTSNPHISLPDLDKKLCQNPKINVSIVATYERLERDLKKLGVEIKSGYNIEPAFGLLSTRIHNRNRSKRSQDARPSYQ